MQLTGEARKKIEALNQSFLKDKERADMRHAMTSQWLRRRVLQYTNGGISTRP